jgi:thiamine biosynthesis lipoprotein
VFRALTVRPLSVLVGCVTAARALTVAFACMLAGSASAQWLEAEEPIMGTRVHAELWHDDPDAGQALLARVMAEMRRVEAAYSPYREDSELSRLNREGGRGWVTSSAEMIELLSLSAKVSRLTDGAFDVTFASVGRYYDYRAGRRPADEELARALEAINYEHVEIDARHQRVRFRHPLVYVDLGGIAKGWAVDRCIALLAAAGVRQATVSAGGDSRILGDRRGQPWTVGVRDPRDEDGVAVLLPLVDTAVSTSGDYERFFMEDGVRYHHILDPATGESARGSMSVTIIGPEAAFTDALSTSVFVLGPQAGIELVNRLPGIDAVIIDADGRMHYSSELAPP